MAVKHPRNRWNRFVSTAVRCDVRLGLKSRRKNCTADTRCFWAWWGGTRSRIATTFFVLSLRHLTKPKCWPHTFGWSRIAYQYFSVWMGSRCKKSPLLSNVTLSVLSNSERWSQVFSEKPLVLRAIYVVPPLLVLVTFSSACVSLPTKQTE